MAYTDCTIADLIATQNEICLRLRGKGFDSVEKKRISIYQDGTITFCFELEDDFQRELNYEDRISEGPFYCDLDNYYEKVQRVPSRERRELEVLTRQLGRIHATQEQYASLEGKKFVAKLLEDAQPYFNMIADMREHSAQPFKGDTIPF